MATVQEVQNDIYECRVKLLKQMNDYIINIGDEEIWGDWILAGVPDEATEDDYDFIKFSFGADKIFIHSFKFFSAI